MSDSIEKTEIPIQPSEAVADAVMISYKKMLEEEGYPKNKNDLNEVFRLATESKCDKSSLNVLEILALKHASLFKKMLLITSHDVSSSMGQFSYHSYFLVEDVNGYWTAASPANHGLNKDNSYATTIFRDKNLGSVIKSISDRDEMDFPSAGQIREKLIRFPDVVRREGEIEFLELDLVAGDVFVDTRTRVVD